MKIYDKELFKTQQELGTIFLIIIVFAIGFVVGYITSSFLVNSEKDKNKAIRNDTIINNVQEI